MKVLKYITKESFARYGFVIDFNNPNSEGWEILTKVSDKGWRIAVLEIDRKNAKRLERHPCSIETFEPMSGVAILLVSRDNPEDFEVFLLDKPVCLNAGIWHEVFSLSEKAKFKITENDEVECEYYNLENPFGFNFDFL